VGGNGGGEFNIPKSHTDFAKWLNATTLSRGLSCLHNNYHRPMTVAALEAGKHVYCEKPMAGLYRDALTMFETAQHAGKQLHIQMSNLYEIETRAAKDLD
jgi:predicted dehydrogenase